MIVELTIALYYVFDSPKDKFIFDVGHQACVHKKQTKENIKSGGFAQNLLNTARNSDIKLKNFYDFALPDEFIEHGERLEILYKYNLDTKSIFNKIIKLLLED